MKKFIKLERIITEEQLAEIEQIMKRKNHPFSVKTLLAEMGTNFCGCDEISTHKATFEVGEGSTKIEKYCTKCIENQSHIKQPHDSKTVINWASDSNKCSVGVNEKCGTRSVVATETSAEFIS